MTIEQGTTADQANRKPKSFFDPQLILRICWSLFRRRWIPLTLSLFLAIVLGLVGAIFLKETVWRGSALLLYTPPPIPDSIKSMQDSLELQNISGLITSRPVTEQIKSDLALDFPAFIMEKAIKAETSRLGSTIFISMDWKDRDEVVEILNQLAKVYPEYVAEVRRNIAKARLRESEGTLANLKSKLESARQRYLNFTRKNNVVAFKQDIAIALQEISSLESQVKESERDETSYLDQIKMLEKQLNSIREEQSAEAKAAAKFEAAAESLADNRRRQNRLRELIEEERRLIEVNAQLEVKRKELERAQKLAERDLIPQSQLEQAQGSVDSLIAKITENKKIMKWKTELTDLDKLVVPKNNVVKKGSPIISQILFRKLEVELSILHGKKARAEMNRDLKGRKAQVARFQRLSSDLKAMEDEMESINDERQAVAAVNGLLRQLASFGPIEFSTLSPASTGLNPIKNTKKKVFLGITFSVMLVLSTMIAGYDVLCNGIIPLDAQLERLGLPVIARLGGTASEIAGDATADDEAESPNQQLEEGTNTIAGHATDSVPPVDLAFQPPSEEIRALTLQLRQTIRNSGSTLLFGNLCEDRPLAPLLQELSQCLADRDERVLLIDIQPDHDEELLDLIDITEGPWSGPEDVDIENAPGIYDWLSFGRADLREVTWPSKWAGIDCILSGRDVHPEALATHRMSELMDEVQRKYTMVMFLAPDAQSATDLQIMAAHLDGMIFQFSARDRLKSTHRESLAALRNLNAPLLGAIEKLS